MSNIVLLTYDESSYFDPHALKLLYKTVGGEQAMHMLQEALGLIELHVEIVLSSGPDYEESKINAGLKTIEIITQSLGLTALSLVCSYMLSYDHARDSHSFHAILSRFERLARQSPVSLRMCADN